MASIAFSGVTELRDGQYAFVAKHTRIHVMKRSNVRFITGGATGVDTLCAYLAYAWKREAGHTLVVPNGAHNVEIVHFFIAMDLDVVYMPEGTDHLDRNTRMIKEADELVAFPGTGDEMWRGSGTWSTIRRARKKRIPIHVYPLNGDMPWKENADGGTSGRSRIPIGRDS